MIDIFAILLTHGLIALAAMRLLMREDLDDGSLGQVDGAKETSAPASAPERPWLKNQTRHQTEQQAEGSDA